MKPLGITLGDASGVGPEILLLTAAQRQLPPCVVYGDLSVLDKANRELAFGVALHAVTVPGDLRPEAVNVVDARMIRQDQITPGRLSAHAGAAAREYVVRAAKDALAGAISSIVTLPMNKEATQLTDPHFTGHTELIGEICGVADVTIMLASPQLIVTHVSTHCSLREAIERAKQPRIRTIIDLTCRAVDRIKPGGRVAVAGLNPHAGENGLFGREEIDEIRPAVEWAQSQGWPVDGPHPPDTLFYLAVQRQRYDAVVCMYHDQGHIPSKLLDFEGGVNIALGLPIVRTSVDHGTAFDIAWQGKASNTSFLKAIEFAQRLIGAAA
jgi:4-hydroxythreonine-4-phosphate dehydrogenase